MPEGVPGIVYGYESIMYCALNDIDVVNCSWGGFSSSCINQSIIDYAVARGVAVVAAAGNHGTATPFYPGAYNGVLNVGVTNPDDDVISMTGHGPTVDIMAPGQQTWTTSSDSTYGWLLLHVRFFTDRSSRRSPCAFTEAIAYRT